MGIISVKVIVVLKIIITSHITALLTLPDKHCISHGMCIYQVMMMLHFLNDVANDAESTHEIRKLCHIKSLV